MNIILNIFLLSIPARLKKRIAYLLSKYSKIFFESYLFQNIDFSLDKEISCLLELPVNFKNVIDGVLMLATGPNAYSNKSTR